ncbi:MAG: DNA replication/repair protein RecF [Anaerolineae bacterium]|nr:DNA replication/repair protein RecF [Anaerolineae bacterium]
MQLKSLSLKNFRLFESLNITIPNKVLLVTGNNAQGKTSLLEAIYYLATFSSFHASMDRQLIRFDTLALNPAVAHIKADFETNHATRHLEIRLIVQQDRSGTPRYTKEILLDTAKKKGTEALGKFNAVLFLPEMTTIIDGSPEERRRYINMMVAQANTIYINTLGQYNKAVQQRNALLKILQEKKNSATSQLDIWDEKMAKLGARLIHERIRVIDELSIEAQFIHHELSHTADSFRIAYVPSFDPAGPQQVDNNHFFNALQNDLHVARGHYPLNDIEKRFLATLQSHRKSDIRKGISSIGPHRDEIRFFTNETDLGIYGSRGQIRTALISLKFAEAQWLKARTGQYPVMLLDEVLAELDQQRRNDLVAFLQKGDQVFLTTTDLNLFDPASLQGSHIWRIHGGILTEG